MNETTMWAVIGITYGAVIAVLNNRLLFRGIRRARERAAALGKPDQGTGVVTRLFGIRYAIDAGALIIAGVLFRNVAFLIAAALSLTILGNILIATTVRAKGGKI
ncbi:MAG: hypothetical protein M1553_02995 [Firmicutes bacterium]|nr:hypothetical protein [Bacillota bacterium]